MRMPEPSPSNFQLERFAIALAAANLRFLIHQLEDLREELRCFLDLLVKVGGMAIGVADILPDCGIRRYIIRSDVVPLVLARWPRALLALARGAAHERAVAACASARRDAASALGCCDAGWLRASQEAAADAACRRLLATLRRRCGRRRGDAAGRGNLGAA